MRIAMAKIRPSTPYPPEDEEDTKEDQQLGYEKTELDEIEIPEFKGTWDNEWKNVRTKDVRSRVDSDECWMCGDNAHTAPACVTQVRLRGEDALETYKWAEETEGTSAAPRWQIQIPGHTDLP